MSEPRRSLTVGDRRYHWRVRHRHRAVDGGGVADCREILTFWLVNRRRARLSLVFRGGGPDHGEVSRDGHFLNLHRPGVARAFLDVAISEGWDQASQVEMDGWALFERALPLVPPEP